VEKEEELSVICIEMVIYRKRWNQCAQRGGVEDEK